MSIREFQFHELNSAPLVVDAVYRGGKAGNTADDPINRLIPGVGNQGGFRFAGSSQGLECSYVVLFTTEADPDWPDSLDLSTGQFTYYGDNKHPGHDLHDTPRRGNLVLRDSFAAIHQDERDRVPPFFVFSKAGSGRDVKFRGLAVPGNPVIPPTEDLVAIWKSVSGNRFQNYRAVFTILDIPEVPRQWLEEIRSANRAGSSHSAWIRWQESGLYTPLRSERSRQYRTREEQLPASADDIELLTSIHTHFQPDPIAFEQFSAEIFRLLDVNVLTCDVTRPWRDGGRDAIGSYGIGILDNRVVVDFALEAKCYALKNSVGVREVSRLISRLRHRQFGVIVTTSFVNVAAYREIVEDGHPVLILSGIDIVRILRNSGRSMTSSLTEWLNVAFPLNVSKADITESGQGE